SSLVPYTTLFRSPDAAGLKSAIKHIPLFLAQDIRVEVVTLPVDPDDFTRKYPNAIEKYTLPALMSRMREVKGGNKSVKKSIRVDGFKFLMDHKLTGNEIDDAKTVNELLEVIISINDTAMKDIYAKWLAKESGITVTQLNKWKKEAEEKVKTKVEDTTMDWFVTYMLPKEVEIPLEELKPTIEKYGMFQANNKIWIKQGDDPPFSF